MEEQECLLGDITFGVTVVNLGASCEIYAEELSQENTFVWRGMLMTYHSVVITTCTMMMKNRLNSSLT